jgi:hypothetical protein
MSTTEILDKYDENGPIGEDGAPISEEADVELLELQSKSGNPSPDPISAGVSMREGRIKEARAIFRSQIRHQDPDVSPDVLETRLEARMRDFLKQPEKVLRIFDLLSPTCRAASKDNVFEAVEFASIRRMDLFSRIEDELKRSEFGRPSTHDVTVSAFVKSAIGSNSPQIKKAAHDFFGSDGLLDWASSSRCIGSLRGRTQTS